MTTPQDKTEQTAPDLLADPLPSDDLDERLKAQGTRSTLTTVLAAVAIAAVAFAGGVFTHSALADDPAPTAAGQGGFPGRGQGGFPGGGQGGVPGGGTPGGGARQGGGGLSGTVVRVDGKNLVLKTANGEITIALTDTTKVNTATAGSVADLTEGATVQVQATRGQDGGMSATTVTRQP